MLANKWSHTESITNSQAQLKKIWESNTALNYVTEND
jgi:hypothetical protein